MGWKDINGAVVADTVYCDDVLVAKDTSFTIPGIAFATADVAAMGTMSVPIIGMLENMQLTVKQIGVDKGLSKLNKLKAQNLEFRWVETVVKSDGSLSQEGRKAFVRTMPSAIPDIGVENGSATELESTFNVTRCQVYADGKELFCVDRLANVLRVGGKDYYSKIANLL